MTLPPVVRLLRPHQYTKNLLVFTAPGAAGKLDEAGTIARSLAAFALFCVVSSIGYVVNDLVDAERDRLHPRKRTRPIASGAVSPSSAGGVIVALTAIAVVGALALTTSFALTLLGYGTLTLLYSNVLKRIPWLELVAVSTGFVLRALGGGAATDTSISIWFLLVVSGGALLLITGKRLGELLNVGPDAGSRAVLGAYPTSGLQRLAAFGAFYSVGAYLFWAIVDADKHTTSTQGTLLLRLTVIPFAFAIARFAHLSLSGRGEQPELLVVRDPVVLVAGAAWALLYALGLYL